MFYKTKAYIPQRFTLTKVVKRYTLKDEVGILATPAGHSGPNPTTKLVHTGTNRQGKIQISNKSQAKHGKKELQMQTTMM